MSPSPDRNNLKCLQSLCVGDVSYAFYSLSEAQKTIGSIANLPCCLRVFLENLFVHEASHKVSLEDLQALCAFYALKKNAPSLPFRPSHIFMNEEDAISALTDVASLQSEIQRQSPTPERISLACPLDIVVDQTQPPFHLGKERMALLRWSEKNFNGVRVVPAGKGACGPVNLDYLYNLVHTEKTEQGGPALVSSDIIMCSTPHLSMLGALGCLTMKGNVLDIETILLGANLSIPIPGVIGVKLTGKSKKDISATDIALELLNKLPLEELKGKFIEFFGPGVDQLSIPDRAIIANILGQTEALGIFFAIDAATLAHLALIGKSPDHIALIETHAKEQGLWRESWPHDAQQAATFSLTIDFALSSPHIGVSGLEKETSFTPLTEVFDFFAQKNYDAPASAPLDTLRHGDIVFAEISACSSAHPKELVAAGLLAKRARALGLYLKPWVRAHLSLGAPHIRPFLESLGLLEDLKGIGFSFDKKDLSDKARSTLHEFHTKLASIRSGWDKEDPVTVWGGIGLRASPLMVVAYGLVGSLNHDFTTKPIFTSGEGESFLLKDIWPSTAEIKKLLEETPLEPFYKAQKEALFTASPEWAGLWGDKAPDYFPWDDNSAYIKSFPLAVLRAQELARLKEIKLAQLLAVFGENVAASQIVPKGEIQPEKPAGVYLQQLGVPSEKLGHFGFYTGQSEVMTRGAFSGPALFNLLLHEETIGKTPYAPSNEVLPYFEAAARYRETKTPLLLAAGKNFGHGQEQEWAAKVIRLLGINVVIADSFDPAFRLNLIRVGILPLQMKHGAETNLLNLKAKDKINIIGFDQVSQLPCEVLVTFEQESDVSRYMLSCAIQNDEELAILRKGSLWNAFISAKI